MIKLLVDDFFYLKMTEDWYGIYFDVSDSKDAIEVIDWCTDLETNVILNSTMEEYYKKKTDFLPVPATTYKIWFKDQNDLMRFKLIWK